MNIQSRLAAVGAAVALALLAGCGKNEAPAKPLARIEFNTRAAEEFLPLFWREDANNDGQLQPDELAVLWGFPDEERGLWVKDGAFTAKFDAAYKLLATPPAASDDAEGKRLALVRKELAQGAPTLVRTDVSGDSPAEQQLLRHLMRAATLIERLYARQNGVLDIEARIPRTDLASRALFHRNQSPFCDNPLTANDPACNALAEPSPQISGLYPAELQQDKGFCQTLEKAPNGAALMDHFSIVAAGEKPGTWKAVPYPDAWTEDMHAVAAELRAAADAFGEAEPAFTAYLRAAAQAFTDNDWEPANRAWVAMNARNSRWYARIAPDEVYYDPCAWKAGFALQLARINPDSIAWQEKLEPHKAAMEQALAKLAGSPYKARDVQFKLPDFIDVVLNAGDQRSPTGATIGQSLPNWGPVAASGGRTVAMTNLYTDPDSIARRAAQQASVFCTATNAAYVGKGNETVIDSLLHEAAHNLGPSHEYRAAGLTDDESFGGPLASTLEELKAQNSSLFLLSFLQERGVFSEEDVRRVLREGIAWAFGHISRGMYTGDGSPRTYSQLAAIQVGSFRDAGALQWKAQEKSASGEDTGCLEIDFDKLPAAVAALEETVLKIKARGDKAGAEALKAKYVDGQDDYAQLRQAIADRYVRAPKATFVYSIEGLPAS
jgi:hypothetical protein